MDKFSRSLILLYCYFFFGETGVVGASASHVAAANVSDYFFFFLVSRYQKVISNADYRSTRLARPI